MIKTIVLRPLFRRLVSFSFAFSTVFTLAVSPLASANTYYALGSNKEVLGAGFESKLGMPLDSCLDGDWVFQGGSQGGLTYQGAFDKKTMINTLGGSVKGGINLVIFGGSVKYSMRTRTTESSSTAASTTVLNYEQGSYNFENRRLKPAIASLLQTNPSAVRNQCGDGFIHNIRKGSNLYVTAKLHFKDRSKYEWYQTKIKIKVLFFSKTKTKTKEFYEATKDAVYSIEVNTDGGMTPKLAQLTQGGPRYCKTDNMDTCIDYADSIFSYLLENGQYANDLNQAPLEAITYDVASYEKSGHYDLAYAATQSVSDGYIALSARLRGYQDLVNEDIQNLKAFLAVATEQAEIDQLTQRLAEREAQKDALYLSADYCYTLPGVLACENHLEASIAQVD